MFELFKNCRNSARIDTAYKSELEKVREFLDKGANVNLKDEYGDTALIYDIKDQ